MPDSDVFGVADESNMVLTGLSDFDPPKESKKAAIDACEHGVRTVVPRVTARGRRQSLRQSGGGYFEVLTGSDVEEMDDKALLETVKPVTCLPNCHRVKERVVSAFQDAGHTVGIWGTELTMRLPCARQMWYICRQCCGHCKGDG